MPTFFDLQKFAHTGITSPDMTAFDKARALAAFGGGKTRTLTGVPPLSFKANGKPLISWSMLGNGQQSGTPSPDNIIMPEFVGKRTGNLFDMVNFENAYPALFDISGSIVRINTTAGRQALYSDGLEFAVQAPFSISFKGESTNNAATNGRFRLQFDDDSYEEIQITKNDGSSNQYVSATFDKNLKRIKFNWSSFNEGMAFKDLMLNLGSTALPYEPYGYKIPITCAGQTTPVYLGQVSMVRKIGKLVLKGDTNITTFSTTNVYQLSIPVYDISINGLARSAAYSNITPYGMSVDNRGTYGGIGCYLTDSGHSVTFNLYGYQGTFPTPDSFKSYLATQYAAGTPVCVWYVLAEPETAIVNEPLAKIGDYADELHSEDAGVTIPTTKGQNTLTVDTELQPSEMTITYKK